MTRPPSNRSYRNFVCSPLPFGRGVRGEGLATTAGDVYTLRFDLPDGGDHELFLETRGYYLEWIRDEWIAEENLPRARMVLRDPRKALRVLAPEFKKVEPVIEEIFWRSKYAPQ